MLESVNPAYDLAYLTANLINGIDEGVEIEVAGGVTTACVVLEPFTVSSADAVAAITAIQTTPIVVDSSTTPHVSHTSTGSFYDYRTYVNPLFVKCL